MVGQRCIHRFVLPKEEDSLVRQRQGGGRREPDLRLDHRKDYLVESEILDVAAANTFRASI